MDNQLKKHIDNLKEFWERQAKKTRITIIAVAVGVVLFSVVLAVMLNAGTDGYVELYSGLDATENAHIYQMLKDMGVPVKVDTTGQIMVQKADKDSLMLELSALGYPKTAPSYDIFTSNAGLTTTEFEKKQYLLFQLQDRIEKTLMHIDSVQSAIVTLVVPEESSYVWQDNTNEESSASVLITLKPGRELSSTRISAIKNLISSSVPKMNPSNVTVVDALTSLEMKVEGDDSESAYSTNRLNFEGEIEKSIVQKAMNVLSLGYSSGEVRVSATVVIDYDKMITEQLEYMPDEDGNGIVQNIDERYIMDPQDLASGIVGEENNTDIPIYVDTNDDGVPDNIYYVRDVNYVISYIKRQIEKDNTELVKATVAVSLRDDALTNAKRDKIVNLVANATNILPENITVEDLLAPEVIEPTEPAPETNIIVLLQPYFPYIIAGIILLAVLLIIALVIIRVFKTRKNSKKEADEINEEDLAAKELQNAMSDAEAQRRKLRDLAVANLTRENAVSGEVREFAQQNPEITATLIRNWLKEGE